MVVFGMRTTGFLASWVSKPETEKDPILAKKLKSLHEFQATLTGLQENISLYLDSWKVMCKASEAIADGLAKLSAAKEHGSEGETFPLLDMTSADSGERWRPVASKLVQKNAAPFREQTLAPLWNEVPVQMLQYGCVTSMGRVAEDMVRRQLREMLGRFPPIYCKVERRRQLLSEFTAAASKVRSAESAKDRERDKDESSVAAVQRRKSLVAFETIGGVLNGVTQEVIADVDRLEAERPKMLVPQISALVGCEAFFFRRSALALERLATALPYSALALCRLVPPPPPSQPGRAFSLPSTEFNTAASSQPSVSPAPVSESSDPPVGSTISCSVDGVDRQDNFPSSSAQSASEPSVGARSSVQPIPSVPGGKSSGGSVLPQQVRSSEGTDVLPSTPLSQDAASEGNAAEGTSSLMVPTPFLKEAGDGEEDVVEEVVW